MHFRHRVDRRMHFKQWGLDECKDNGTQISLYSSLNIIQNTVRSLYYSDILSKNNLNILIKEL